MSFLILAISILLIGADQITKYFVDLKLKPIGTVEVIKGFFSLDYLENKGAALGILQDHRWVFIVLTTIVCIAMIVFLFHYKKHNFWTYSTICLIFAGGVGNLIDRIFRGYVIDFIYIHFFSYRFNIADICVTVGSIVFIITMIMLEKNERKKASELENENI